MEPVGFLIVYQWLPYASPQDSLWIPYVWSPYAFPMDALWIAFGSHMDSPWHPYGFRQVWIPYEFPMDSLWVPNGFPMGSLWIYILMTFVFTIKLYEHVVRCVVCVSFLRQSGQ